MKSVLIIGMGRMGRHLAKKMQELGNEAHGLGADVLAAADHRVSIPIRGRAESLNIAAAAAICLYESARIQAR